MFCSAFFGLMLLAVLFSIEMGRKLHWSLGLAIGVLLLSGGYSFFLPQFYPIPVNPMNIARGGGEVLYSVSMILLFSSLLLSRTRQFFKYCLNILFFISVLDSIALIVEFLFFRDPNPYITPHGILFNGTADACFIACLWPISFKRNWILAPIMLLAILFSHSNTAIAGLGIGYAFYLLPRMRIKQWIVVMGLVTPIFVLLARFCLGGHFLADSGRSFVWAGSFHFYKQFANPFIGIGTGTFTVWGDAWQRAHYQGDTGTFPIWNFLHNDFLEILFENGILGLTTSLLVLVFLLKRTYRNPVFPIVCVYAFTGLTEMPLRLFITQFLGICLLSEGFKPKQ